MLKGPIAQATIRTSFVLGLRLIVQAGTLLLVARMLGPEQFGAFAGVAALAVLMGTFSTFGTHLVLLGAVSKDQARRAAVLAYAVPTTLITGSLLFLLYLVIFQTAFSNFGLPLTAMACIGITEALILPLFLLPANEQLALEKTAQSQLLIIMPLAMRMLAALAVMLTAPEQPLTVFASLYLITALLSVGIMKLYKNDSWLSFKDWRLPRLDQLKHSSGYATLAMTTAGPSELDKMLAVKLMPLGASGLYAAASRVIGATVLPVIALLLAAQPRLFRSANQNLMQNQHLTRWLFISALAYGLALTCLLWFCAPMVQWLFGEQYKGMTDMLRWLCLTVPPLTLRLVAANTLMTQNHPWLRAGMEAWGMMTLVGCAYLFTPHWGSRGLPLALAVSETSMVLYFFIINSKLGRRC